MQAKRSNHWLVTAVALLVASLLAGCTVMSNANDASAPAKSVAAAATPPFRQTTAKEFPSLKTKSSLTHTVSVSLTLVVPNSILATAMFTL